MVFGFDISLQWSIYCQTMWRESNWTEIVPNRGTIWQNISIQSSNVYKSIDYRVWCCWFQSGTTNGYYFLTIVHLVERYKIDFGIEWSKCVSYQQGCPKVWKSRGQGWRREGEAHAPPPQILEDQKTGVVVPARRITTRTQDFQILRHPWPRVRTRPCLPASWIVLGSATFLSIVELYSLPEKQMAAELFKKSANNHPLNLYLENWFEGYLVKCTL